MFRAFPSRTSTSYSIDQFSIEPSATENKLVHGGRGGYCFEHNTLLCYVLEAVSFQVSVLSARARYQLPPQVRRPRTHVLLRVELEGESYLVDGGFGGLSPTAALRLGLNAESRTPHEPRRLKEAGRARSARDGRSAGASSGRAHRSSAQCGTGGLAPTWWIQGRGVLLVDCRAAADHQVVAAIEQTWKAPGLDEQLES
jgi:hypothetical protein